MLPVTLFLLTAVTTTFLGAGPWYALAILTILGAHEFGHYFAARYHQVAVTLPYFIPMPLTFGTLGAFIQLKEPVPDRRKLFDIGVAGPLADRFYVMEHGRIVEKFEAAELQAKMPVLNQLLGV